MKPAIVLIALFLASVGSIVSGYSDFVQLFDATNWNSVIKAIPVLSTALVITTGSLVIMLVAFWLCRGDRDVYQYAVLGYSYCAPFLIGLVLLPGAQSKPDWAPLNHEIMFLMLTVSQVAATYTLRDWFWSKGTHSDA